ncbi:Uu.00g125390.m01.CDS01 [Anthostomella pinea]|uniref:Uu.00g125390.m01.CDS01 n=1 Tax=Anthostomella pinea TaxID=933095 RepID=A0AAI8YHK8_9PEZI|nr:Uu.00g125390.m01.CDS01 [Anthostomella pinea]
MLVLGGQDVETVLTGLSVARCHGLLNALSQALSDYSSDRKASEPTIHQPLRQGVVTKLGNTSLFMPASNTVSTGIKIVTLSASRRGARGAINIFNPGGELVGLLNAEEITAFRTGLVSMIPFLNCGVQKSRIVVFGAGKQAEWHVRLALLLAGDSIQYITVVNRRGETLNELEKRLQGVKDKHPQLTLSLIAKDGATDYEAELKHDLRECDAIMCCTPSTEPLFPSAYLAPAPDEQPRKRFISLIGSYKPHMQEIDSETLLSGKRIYVDSAEACLEEAGELIKAKVPESRLMELGAIASWPSIDEVEGNVVFKCVGMGIMDVAVASELLKIAGDMKIGKTIEDF